MERLSAYEVISRITPVFRDYGYDGASLTALSAAAGLSRASLYHHFPGGKEDMARAVLARSGAALMRLIIAPLSHPLSPTERTKAMFDGVKNYYQGDPPTCLMNSLTLGQGCALFSSDVAAAVAAWQKALSAMFRDGGLNNDVASAQAIEVIERIQGGLILARVTGNKAAFHASIDDLSVWLCRQY